MTLTEYCQQRDPVRMPDVLLQEGEYKVLITLNLAGKMHLRAIHVIMFNHEYAEKNDGTGILWTTDDHGNPKSRSCFRIPPYKEPT